MSRPPGPARRSSRGWRNRTGPTMILSGDVPAGRRYLSEAAVEEMMRRQTCVFLKESYGQGWSMGGGKFGHGGAYATNMANDRPRGPIAVSLVQHAGFPGDGDPSQAAFRRAAVE